MFLSEYIMARSKFFDEIKIATIERQVEDVYNKGITMYFIKDNNISLEYPYGCDGVLTVDMFLKLLIEYKYNEELLNPVSRAKVLVQILYYLKKFEINGERLPNIIMVGDINEVFVLNADDNFTNYLDEKIDWNIAPSCAHEKNPDLVLKIANDENINPFVWNVDENFSFLEVVNRIKELATNNPRHVRITEHNISKIFDYFTSKVIKDSNKIAPNDLVGIFISAIIDKENCYKHPNNPNILVANNKQIQINGRNLDSFFSYFEKEYSPEEKNKFTEISDRLIEDTKRRRSGEFYTPTLFTDYAHKMLSEQLGEDWKEKYVVWDCCWGTGNLTRDYQFKELYASTLEQAELDCGQRYNPEATKFVFDFLNETIENMYGWNEKIPLGLREALKNNKQILFFINPPYATSSDNNGKGKGQNACKTIMYEKMKKENYQEACKNLFSQFLYRILQITKHYNLSNIYLALFCNPIYLSGTSFKNFRTEFLRKFEYKEGILFNAGCFSDVSTSWGIDFTIWKSGETTNKNIFNHKLIEEFDNEIKTIGEKNIYNIDGMESGKDWIKENLKDKKILKIKYPPLSNAITVNCGKNSNTSIYSNALGCYFNVGNDVYQSTQRIAIFSSCDNSNANGLSIISENFENIITMFSARRLVVNNWINHIDQYLQPNIYHEEWNNFFFDSIIFSLFESKSQQSSLRNIDFENQNWNIKNEFFFMSKNEIMNLANENNFDYTYNDARVSEERFVYKKLQEIELSKEAQDVLNKAIELTKKSFKYRELFNQEHPEYQIMNWDCGWYQIKAVLKEYFSEDLKDFQELYKILSDKMRPMVYELGFLK